MAIGLDKTIEIHTKALVKRRKTQPPLEVSKIHIVTLCLPLEEMMQIYLPHQSNTTV